MNISIIGAGNIGGTLGRKWAAAGHTVVFGVRDPQAEKVRSLLAQIEGKVTAVAIPDMVLLALPGRAVAEAIAQWGGQLNGKIVIDATNNVGQQPMHSLDQLRPAAPGSPLFRAFSTLGWENFAEPVIDGVQVDLFYCGDSGAGETAVSTHSGPAVASLITDVGLRPIYIGGLEQADLLDTLTRLWFTLAFQQGRGRHLALKLLEPSTQ